MNISIVERIKKFNYHYFYSKITNDGCIVGVTDALNPEGTNLFKYDLILNKMIFQTPINLVPHSTFHVTNAYIINIVPTDIQHHKMCQFYSLDDGKKLLECFETNIITNDLKSMKILDLTNNCIMITYNTYDAHLKNGLIVKLEHANDVFSYCKFAIKPLEFNCICISNNKVITSLNNKISIYNCISNITHKDVKLEDILQLENEFDHSYNNFYKYDEKNDFDKNGIISNIYFNGFDLILFAENDNDYYPYVFYKYDIYGNSIEMEYLIDDHGCMMVLRTITMGELIGNYILFHVYDKYFAGRETRIKYYTLYALSIDNMTLYAFEENVYDFKQVPNTPYAIINYYSKNCSKIINLTKLMSPSSCAWNDLYIVNHAIDAVEKLQYDEDIVDKQFDRLPLLVLKCFIREDAYLTIFRIDNEQ